MLNASAWIADQGPGYEMVWGYAGGARKLNFLHTFLRAISSSSARPEVHDPGARGYNHANGDSEALPRRLQSWA